MFDAYRQFYGQRPDLPGAAAFLTERLTRGEAVVFLALDGESALGFVQLYPSFSSVRMRPIWIPNDLFVAERDDAAASRGHTATGERSRTSTRDTRPRSGRGPSRT